MSLNIDKTECLLMGSLKNRYRNIAGINICSYTKCLGIYIGHDMDECVQKNWYHKIKELEKALHVWKKRKLTNVTNFLEIRKLLHGIPQFYVEVLSAFNECKHIDGNLTCDQFLSQPIWNNKLFKYNGETLCYKKTGLRLAYCM